MGPGLDGGVRAMNFDKYFLTLTGHAPLRWQRRLYQRFVNGDLPTALDLPTGLGKTSVMAVWLIAKCAGASVPNRLVYVVDRRTIVDQATAEAEKLRERAEILLAAGELPISTLRGQYVDNRRWMENPAAPAIVIGTVDMIGSRLLFRGYGASAGMRPFQAGLLGADTLLVLDEAHLCPPFQALLETIAADETLRPNQVPVPPFRLLALSATGKRQGNMFTLEAEDEEDAFVRTRLAAAKSLKIVPATGNLDEQLVQEALTLANEHGGRIAIFCTSRDVAQKVAKQLGDKKARRPEGAIVLLAGARRVKEREASWKELARAGFLPADKKGTDEDCLPVPTFLVATAAGEVGIDLDADHAVMDLVTAERMVQRLGRVNRTGGEGRIAWVRVIDVSAETESEDSAARRIACRHLLESLPLLPDGGRDASPGSLRGLRDHPQLASASTPAPLYPALDRATLDAWAMTSLSDHPGRPDIAPWLRGWVAEEDPEITLVWRRWPWDESELLLDAEGLATFFDTARPRLLEKLQAPRSLALKILSERAKRVDWADSTIVIVALGNPVRTMQLGELKDKNKRDRFFGDATTDTVFVVHHGLGGLDKQGLLARDAIGPTDCLDAGWEEAMLQTVGLRVIEAPTVGMRPSQFWQPIGRFVLAPSENPDAERFLCIEAWRDGQQESGGDPAIRRQEQGLEEHLQETAAEAAVLAAALNLPNDYRAMLVAAAKAHDLGKARPHWQRAMGAPRGGGILAKTKGTGANLALLQINGQTYRHEFGSLLDLEREPGLLTDLPEPLHDLALHLVAAHHGYARPWIAPVDPDPRTSLASHRERAAAAALRFARLQSRWGPWGLAWWEALLRAADQRVSRRLDQREDV